MMKSIRLTRSALLLLASCCVSAIAQPRDLENRIEHGEYLSRVGDCIACHTTPGKEPFSGGLKMTTPVGAIYSTNITPDKKYGIGNYSYKNFANAVRKGVRKDGTYLYPAMPYPSFAKINDDDLQDLYLYFRHGVKPSAQQNKKSDIPWPLNMRWPLFAWNALFRHDGIYQTDMQQTTQWNRGAYLVQGLGHCGSCHTPRGIGFQEKALDQTQDSYLSGGTLEGWHAPDLHGDNRSGLGQWSEREIIQFLKTGHTEKSAAFGSMVDVIQNSTQHFGSADLQAVAVYLKSFEPLHRDEQPVDYSDKTTKELSSGKVFSTGAQLYLDNCATCHRSDGQGYRNTFPALAHNPVVQSKDPSSLISVVLHGSRVPITQSAPTGLTMPDFGWRLSDQEIAQLLSFVRDGWGNKGTAVTAGQVKAIRNQNK